MKNRLMDLNNHLFAQMERLSDEETKDGALTEEMQRARVVTGIANQIINNARLALDAAKALSDGYVRTEKTDRMLGMLGIQEDKNNDQIHKKTD